MRAKPVVPRARANRDVDEAIEHYLREDADQAALDFIEALRRAYAAVSRHPTAGSARYAHELDIPGLRSWRLKRFPYQVFYLEGDDRIDVWRVLHSQRDIPKRLRDDTDAG